MNKILTILVSLTFFHLQSRNAYAYVDPGTGSFFLQLLIASLLGAAFTIKKYFKRLFKESIDKAPVKSGAINNEENSDSDPMGVESIQELPQSSWKEEQN